MNDKDNLANRVIEQLYSEKETEEEKNPFPDQWGIDETGFPWPNPVTAQAIAAWIFFKHGEHNGMGGIFKIDDDIFINRKKVSQNRSTLLSLYSKPNMVIWANKDENMRDIEALWRQIKSTIGTEWPIVWKTVMRIAPEYNRDYIKISDNMIWSKDRADVLYKDEGEQ